MSATPNKVSPLTWPSSHTTWHILCLTRLPEYLHTQVTLADTEIAFPIHVSHHGDCFQLRHLALRYLEIKARRQAEHEMFQNSVPLRQRGSEGAYVLSVWLSKKSFTKSNQVEQQFLDFFFFLHPPLVSQVFQVGQASWVQCSGIWLTKDHVEVQVFIWLWTRSKPCQLFRDKTELKRI